MSDSNLIEVNCEIVPRNLDVKHGYSSEQKKQILEMMKIYRNVVYYAGLTTGLGSEADAPGSSVLETLLEVKRQADSLPPQFREFDPDSFESIEETIRYCQRRK